MTTTKTTTTAFELDAEWSEELRIVIGYSTGTFFVKTFDGILQYMGSEMTECYGLTDEQLVNMKQVLSA